MCIGCSGIHRSLGVHISFVRSVNLDTWTSAQVKFMESWGNKRAKSYYEARVPRDIRPPTEHSSLREREQWIRDKYERRRFVAIEEPTAASSDDEEDEEESPPPRRRTSRSNRSNPSRGPSNSEQQPPSKASAQRQQKKNESVDILSFDDPSPPPAATNSTKPQNDNWANFQGSSKQQQVEVPSDNTSNAAQSFLSTPAHNATTAAIMASFGNSQPSMPMQQPGGMPMQGMQMRGMPMANQGMQMQGMQMRPPGGGGNTMYGTGAAVNPFGQQQVPGYSQQPLRGYTQQPMIGHQAGIQPSMQQPPRMQPMGIQQPGMQQPRGVNSMQSQNPLVQQQHNIMQQNSYGQHAVQQNPYGQQQHNMQSNQFAGLAQAMGMGPVGQSSSSNSHTGFLQQTPPAPPQNLQRQGMQQMGMMGQQQPYTNAQAAQQPVVNGFTQHQNQQAQNSGNPFF